MVVFISHRRASSKLPGALAKSITAAIQGQGEEGLATIIDYQHVNSPGYFATELVDQGLNSSDAMIVTIDRRWIETVDKVTLSSQQRTCTDWVEFEIRYALDYQLPIILVGEKANLDQISQIGFSGYLQLMQYCAMLEIDLPDRLSDSEAEELIAQLRNLTRKHARRRSHLSAGPEHNKARTIFRHHSAFPKSLNFSFASGTLFAILLLSLLQCATR